MAARVYSPPTNISVPELNFSNVQEYQRESGEYLQKLKDHLVARNPNGKNVGEIIKFPVADGYAEYMVASMKPLELVHIPLWDAWEYRHVERLTVQDVTEQIEHNATIASLFQD